MIVRKKAYLLQDSVQLNLCDVNDIIKDFINDFICHDGESTLALPTIVKGEFYGYIDEGNWPIGTFFATNGRVYKTEVEKVTEVTSAALGALPKYRFRAVN